MINPEDYLKKLANEPISEKVFKPREGQVFTRRELAAAIGVDDWFLTRVKPQLLEVLSEYFEIEEDISTGKSLFKIVKIKKEEGFAYKWGKISSKKR